MDEEFLDKIYEYYKLKEEIAPYSNNIKLLKASEKYKKLINLEDELKREVLGGEELIEILLHLSKTIPKHFGKAYENLKADLTNLIDGRTGRFVEDIKAILDRYQEK